MFVVCLPNVYRLFRREQPVLPVPLVPLLEHFTAGDRQVHVGIGSREEGSATAAEDPQWVGTFTLSFVSFQYCGSLQVSRFAYAGRTTHSLAIYTFFRNNFYVLNGPPSEMKGGHAKKMRR